MKSHTTSDFRRCFGALSKQIQKQAREAYRHFQADPNHPSLRFKKVHPRMPIYSARVGRGHRTVGVLDGEEIVSSGSELKEYERVISQQPKTG